MLSLTDSVSKLHLLKPEHEKALGKLGINTVRDLLHHFPRDWRDRSEIKKISDIRPGEPVNLRARVKSVSNPGFPFRRVRLTEVLLEDETGNVVAVWFNQPYIKNNLKVGQEYFFSGKTQIYSAKKQQTLQLAHPIFELVKSDTIHVGGIIPEYPLTENITQKQIRYWLKQCLPTLTDLADLVPQTIRTRLKLIGISPAIRNIHFPENPAALETAGKRLAFEELFLFQLAFQGYKKTLKNLPAPTIPLNPKLISKFVKMLPFQLTASQRLATWEILRDIAKAHPMNRLLEGEVGSGKTVVAGLAMYETAHQGFQSVLLAPTEILALQHYETLKKLFAHTDLEIALLTRSHKMSSVIARGTPRSNPHEIATPLGNSPAARNDKLFNNIDSSKIKIIVGTHALLQEHIKFQNLGLLVVDEQHRFGVKQRQALLRGQTQTDTSTNAEAEFLYKDLTYKIRQCLFEIRKEIGLGHKEIIYQKALTEKFKIVGLSFEKEKQVPIIYNNKKIGVYQPDFIVENKIILELKTLPFVGNLEKSQIWNYLKGSTYKLGLLANFSSTDIEINRIVYDTARTGQRSSVSSPRESALVPHLLSMTATPIPRTLALAFYGDLDISQLKELPSGRKKVITRLVAPENRAVAYEFIRKELARGRQAYVIVPLVGEPQTDADNTLTNADKKSVITETEKLSKIFPEFQIGSLHGRMEGEEKKSVMQDFKDNKIQILVSTTVVEVGVDVPNATVMIIENADRFGLATLHQLRGRVGRGKFQSLCILFAETNSEVTGERLKAMVNSNDGFELAEIDLRLRGAGEILGTRQSGYIPFKIARLSDARAIEVAKKEALALLDEDPQLSQYPELAQKVGEISKEAHLE